MENKFTNRYGSWRSDSSIRSVLRSKVYAGLIEFKGQVYEGQHEAIVDQETFEKVQKAYAEREWERNKGDHKPRAFQAKHLLTGLLICGNCGARYFGKGNYSGHGDKKVYRPYYTCYSRSKSAKKMIIDPDCKNKSYAVVALDKIITDKILNLSFDPEAISQIIETVPEQVDNAPILEDRIAEVDKQLTRLMDLYQLGTIPMEQISQRVDALNREKKALIDELEDEEIHVPNLTQEQATDLLKNAEEILTTGTLEKRRELVHSLIDRIELEGEDIIIQWAFV